LPSRQIIAAAPACSAANESMNQRLFIVVHVRVVSFAALAERDYLPLSHASSSGQVRISMSQPRDT